MKTLRFAVIGLFAMTLAIPVLADLPKASDIPPLVKQLTSGANPKMRAQAAAELGHIGTVKASLVKDAVPALLKAAKDKDTTVRIAALKALGEVNADANDAVPLLIEGLKDSNDQVKTAAAQGLMYLGGEAQDALKDLKNVQADLRKLSQEEAKKKRDLSRAVGDAMAAIQGKERKKK